MATQTITSNNNILRTDVIIVGAGLAGIYTALNLPSDLQITMISSYDDNSSLAQGGVATCINDEDTFTSHMEDTLVAGHYINSFKAVKILVKNGPKHIKQLQHLGVEFDKNKDNHILTTIEGGHSHRRVLHINGDQTGKGIMTILKKEIKQRDNIQIISNSRLTGLVTNSESPLGLQNTKPPMTVLGITYNRNNKPHEIHAPFTVLATGGMGDLYARTTNQKGAYGSGIYYAHKAGAKIKDLRFMQFHPTAFWDQKSNRYFLISEALRGEGAKLIDQRDHRFMLPLHHQAELAPRDVVSKAIFDVLSKNKEDYVYLDTRHLDSDHLRHRFPTIYKHLSERGYTLGIDLIPITPVAHYTVGGIETNIHGKTSINGLYACGEVASTGVHGANRLASNSLLECLVYGGNVATSIKNTWKKQQVSKDMCSFSNSVYNCNTHKEFNNNHMSPNHPSGYYKDLIRQIMTEKIGIKRTDNGLNEAIAQLTKLKESLSPFQTGNSDYEEAYQMAVLGLLVAIDAKKHQSLGCHQIESIPS